MFGVLVAWVLARYRFPGRSLVDALVDLPFALPTAVSGIALLPVYARTGWIGRWLEPLGIRTAFSPLGVVLALTFIGLPFVVRTVQPVLEEAEPEVEEAAAVLGASRGQIFRRVLLPTHGAGGPDRLRAGLRAGAGRVRLGGLHLAGTCRMRDRDRPAAHHDPARAVRLRRGRPPSPRCCWLASFALLLGHQPAAGLDAASGRGMA